MERYVSCENCFYGHFEGNRWHCHAEAPREDNYSPVIPLTQLQQGCRHFTPHGEFIGYHCEDCRWLDELRERNFDGYAVSGCHHPDSLHRNQEIKNPERTSCPFFELRLYMRESLDFEED